jgi:hypothetical protein
LLGTSADPDRIARVETGSIPTHPARTNSTQADPKTTHLGLPRLGRRVS